MPRSTRNVSVWARSAALLLATSLSACGAGGSAEVVAKVDGRPITKARFVHWLSIRDASGGTTSASQQAGAKQRVMESLITAEWTLAEASELGVSVSSGEAEKQLSVLEYARDAGFGGYQLLPKEAELKRSLAAKGLTHADRVWLVKLNLLGTKVEQKRRLLAEGAITHTQIAKYYEAHRGQFVVGEEREFMILLNANKPVVLKAKREIEGGKDFLSIAQRVSTYNAAPGGVQRLKRGEEEPEFVAHIFAAKPHTLVGPIKQSAYYYIFELIKITPPRQRTLAEAEASIRRRLAGAARTQTPAQVAEARVKRWKGKTICSAGYVVPLCARQPGAR